MTKASSGFKASAIAGDLKNPGLAITPPQRLGTTSHAAPALEDKIVSSDEEIYVWPYAKGKKRGTSLKPLYKTAPEAALEDLRMHHYLALIDAIRIGKAREQAIAKEELVKLIKLGNEYVL